MAAQVVESPQMLFLKWLATNHPKLYNAYVMNRDPDTQMAGFFDFLGSAVQSVGTFVKDVVQAAPGLIQQYGTTKNDIELIKANITRAQNGQPPISASGQVVTNIPGSLPVSSAGNPLPVPTTKSGSVPVWVWIAGAAAVGFWLLNRR
jgi:hypothetical protein